MYSQWQMDTNVDWRSFKCHRHSSVLSKCPSLRVPRVALHRLQMILPGPPLPPLRTLRHRVSMTTTRLVRYHGVQRGKCLFSCFDLSFLFPRNILKRQINVHGHFCSEEISTGYVHKVALQRPNGGLIIYLHLHISKAKRIKKTNV